MSECPVTERRARRARTARTLASVVALATAGCDAASRAACAPASAPTREPSRGVVEAPSAEADKPTCDDWPYEAALRDALRDEALAFLEALYSADTSTALTGPVSEGGILLVFSPTDEALRERRVARIDLPAVARRGDETWRFAPARGMRNRPARVLAHWVLESGLHTTQCTPWAEGNAETLSDLEKRPTVYVVPEPWPSETDRGLWNGSASPPIVVLQREPSLEWKVVALVNVQVGI
jgi:hypothetical protein